MSDALKKYRSAMGGPSDQQMLREKMRRDDPAKFASLQRRGYDPMSGQEFAPVGGLDAQLLTPDLNPAVQAAPYLVQATSMPVDPAQERERILSDLRWRSWQTPRGQQMRLANLENDAALRARIQHLQTAPVPADYGDGRNTYLQRVINALTWGTGQGGGMR